MEPNFFTRGCIGNKTTGQSKVLKLSISVSGYSEAEFRSGGCWVDNLTEHMCQWNRFTLCARLLHTVFKPAAL
jgi:hypothetical protein